MAPHPDSPTTAEVVRDMRRPQPLHDPRRHEPLRPAAWDDAAVRARVWRIAAALQAEVSAGAIAPHPATHPLDDDSPGPADGYKGLYLGSAGLWWALQRLHGWGLAPPVPDIGGLMDRIAADFRKAPDADEVVPSLFLGEVGVELLRWHASGAVDGFDRLEAAIRGNADNPTREALWGAPGTMWAAWHLARATGAGRWVDAWLHSARALWRSWDWHADAGCHLWLQDMYGRQVHYLGAGHGFIGNVHALLGGLEWLTPAESAELLDRTAQMLSATACRADGAANWAPSLSPPQPGRPRFLMQWCHGAPGFVTALAAGYPADHDATVDALLLEAGEAIWRAGPLTKGAGLCHGTAGNGWALLLLQRRSGSVHGLEQARAMALHALDQSEALQALQGRWRPGLWTGDPGVLLFAAQCLDGAQPLRGLPGLDGL